MGKKTKTSIHIDADLWNEFSIAVIRKEGLRKKNAVLEKLISEYVEHNSMQ